jgi:hypothetical protein
VQTATVTLTFTIGPSTLTPETVALPDGKVGTPYSQVLMAQGGAAPYSWRLVAGMLPPGLSLNPGTGVISGTPTVAVSRDALTFQVRDSGTPTPQTANVPVRLTIAPAP